MTVWVVLAYDHYYPSGDNIRGIYTDKETAKYCAEQLVRAFDNVDVVEKMLKL